MFSPIEADLGNDWIQDRDGYYIGFAGMQVSARDMAKFGLLYLSNGEYERKQILSANWVSDSLQRYTEPARRSYGYFRDVGYGYQWWSGRAGDHYFNYAAGHGGQYIVLLDELDMVIVASADPLYGQIGGRASRHELANINLVGKFINSLPTE